MITFLTPKKFMQPAQARTFFYWAKWYKGLSIFGFGVIYIRNPSKAEIEKFSTLPRGQYERNQVTTAN